ncbi:MAG: hypothetical protein R6U52_01560 [Kosmotogaceae bacterium]
MSIITTQLHLIEDSDGYSHIFRRRCHRKHKSVSADFIYVINRHFNHLEEMQRYLEESYQNEIEKEISWDTEDISEEDYEDVRFLEIPPYEESDYEELANHAHKLRRSPRLEDIREYVDKKK